MKVLAIDFGSASVRVYLVDTSNTMKELDRFSHEASLINKNLCWDIPNIFNKLKKIIDKAIRQEDIQSIGICGWGVDYCLVDEQNNILRPFCYRNYNNIKTYDKYFQSEDKYTLFKTTGIYPDPINTMFQLLSDITSEISHSNKKLLLIADAFAYFLTKEARSELTNASTTQLLNIDATWNYHLIDSLGITRDLFMPIIMPGELYGKYKNIDVIAVCSHDTASAVYATKIKPDSNTLFISSGSWVLLGTLLSKPVTSKKAFNSGFTNERGYNGFTFLRNTDGLFLIQRLVKEYNLTYKNIDENMDSAKILGIIDVNSVGKSISVGNEIQKQLSVKNCTPYDLVKTAYESLAHQLALQVKQLGEITEYNYSDCIITGGMTKAPYLLDRFITLSNLKVTILHGEGSALGNALLQLSIHEKATP